MLSPENGAAVSGVSQLRGEAGSYEWDTIRLSAAFFIVLEGADYHTPFSNTRGFFSFFPSIKTVPVPVSGVGVRVAFTENALLAGRAEPPPPVLLLTDSPYIKHNTSNDILGVFCMKRTLLLLTVLAAGCPAVWAQQENNALVASAPADIPYIPADAQLPRRTFTLEEIIDAFTQYNPAVLEKAARHEDYRQLFSAASTSFNPSGELDADLELAAFAKNFDTSILLYAVGENYIRQYTLQAASGISLTALESQTLADLETLFGSVTDVTREMRKAQLERFRARLKYVKKDKKLDKIAKKEQENLIKEDIRAVKTEIKRLKKDRAAVVKSLAGDYLHHLQRQAQSQTGLTPQAAENAELQARSSANLHVKTNHKKPVAE